MSCSAMSLDDVLLGGVRGGRRAIAEQLGHVVARDSRRLLEQAADTRALQRSPSRGRVQRTCAAVRRLRATRRNSQRWNLSNASKRGGALASTCARPTMSSRLR
jgi:hypothetical protein